MLFRSAWFLAGWAKRLSWREVARTFHTTWDHVFRAVEMAVQWGRAHVNLAGIGAIGIDDIQWQHGHRYLTLVYQLDGPRKRLLWIGRDRRVKTLLGFFRWFGPARTQCLRFVCSDMWKPYLKVIAKKAGHALHVLDRFHIAMHMSEAIEAIRRTEVHELRRRGRQPWLSKTRWLLLKRADHRTPEERGRLRALVRHNLKAVRATLLREDFEPFWTYRSPTWAGKFLDRWCTQVLRSRLDPMKKVARMLRRHRPLILNWFRARGELSAGAVEGWGEQAGDSNRRPPTSRLRASREPRGMDVLSVMSGGLSIGAGAPRGDAPCGDADGGSGGVGLDVADAQVPLVDAQFGRDAGRLAPQGQPGLAGGLGKNLDVGPGDSPPPAGPQNLQDGLLGGEPAGQMLEVTPRVGLAVGEFRRGEAAVEEAAAVLLDHLADSRGFNNVDAVADDHGQTRGTGRAG